MNGALGILHLSSISRRDASELGFDIFIFCILLYVMMQCFWTSTQQIYQKLYQSNITALHWFYLVAAICLDPYLGHHHRPVIKTISLYEAQ
jgi:hypothetical protein